MRKHQEVNMIYVENGIREVNDIVVLSYVFGVSKQDIPMWQKGDPGT